MRARNAIACLAAAAGLTFTPAARATWSIILIDTRTGEIAVGSATCLTNFDLKAGTPILITGVGAGTAQSFVDSTGQNRIVVRDQVLLGTDPNQILSVLSTFDPGHQTRQYGIVDVQGRTATFSGTGAGAWAGGKTGQIGDIAYAIQGNVLSGACVVDAAVDAVATTPGDLAAKLMASMEAARITGGDGRCSCSAGNPPGCGCPPAAFVKSSHIAYMLIARAGDRDGANGLYRVPSNPRSMDIADLNADGRPDLVTANQNGNNLSVLLNITPDSVPGVGGGMPSPFAVFAPALNSPAVAGARSVTLGDLNADGLSDAVATMFASNQIAVLMGKGAGEFDAPVFYPALSNGPLDAVLGDFDGQKGLDVAVVGQNAFSIALRLNQGDGTLDAGTTFTTGGTTNSSIAAGDINGDGKLDLAVGLATPQQISLLFGDGTGGFAPVAPLGFTGGTPNAIVIGDLDNDGDADLATTRSTKNVMVFRQQPGGTFTQALYEVAVAGSGLVRGDVNGDGWPDLVSAGAGTVSTLFNNSAAGGTFLPAVNTQAAASFQDVATADLDGDGDLDLAAPMGGTNVHVIQNNLKPYGVEGFNSGLGAATGDYFMTFNIPNQSGAAPDPVFQLKDLYDDWRADLKGRPDAVRSLVSVKPGTIPPTPGTPVQVLVELLDWQGLIASVPSMTIEAQYEPGSAGATSIQSVAPQGGNVFLVNLQTTGTQGVDRLRITAHDGIRPVVLMPSPTILVGSACLADCDASGALSIDDFICFQTFFSLGDLQADCDGNGTLNIDDFVCFQTAFSLGC